MGVREEHGFPLEPSDEPLPAWMLGGHPDLHAACLELNAPTLTAEAESPGGRRADESDVEDWAIAAAGNAFDEVDQWVAAADVAFETFRLWVRQPTRNHRR